MKIINFIQILDPSNFFFPVIKNYRTVKASNTILPKGDNFF